jgi:hypothetical protein
MKFSWITQSETCTNNTREEAEKRAETPGLITLNFRGMAVGHVQDDGTSWPSGDYVGPNTALVKAVEAFHSHEHFTKVRAVPFDGHRRLVLGRDSRRIC